MSGAMRRIGEYLGLVEEAYDDYDEPTDYREPVVHRDPVTAVAPTGEWSDRGSSIAVAQPMVAERSTITTLQPRTYNEARIVGENFREGIPVIMNLGEMDDADAKRLVDFAAGLVFATRGSIERITSKVFLLSPPNVNVAAEDKRRIAEGGFFNQS